MLTIEQDSEVRHPLLQLGFRPLFLSALIGSAVLTALWLAIYGMNFNLLREDYPFISWHAHEMIFGYATAVVSGFVLTAVRNWTGYPTAVGWSLLLLVLLWWLGRLLPFIPWVPLGYLGVHEALFMGLVVFFALRPVIRVRQWKQLVIFLVIGGLGLASALFHLGLSGFLDSGQQLGLYLGLYLFVALILIMGRRVIPGFIENAIGGGFRTRNNLRLDWLSRLTFLLFLLAELMALVTGNGTSALLSAMFALTLFVLHLFRLSGWHHRDLWHHPLLWSLFLGYGWIAVGFLLKFLSVALDFNPWAAVHAFTYGGVGLMTAGMMARVTLGHTGRNVFAPPASLGVFFGILVSGAFVRVFMVWLAPDAYELWIVAAQLLWIFAFCGLVVVLAPMLIRPRVDGLPG